MVYARNLSGEDGSDVSPFEVSIAIEHLDDEVPVIMSATRDTSDGSVVTLKTAILFGAFTFAVSVLAVL